jgi:hypothetical protein
MSQLQLFIDNSKKSQIIWGLQDSKTSDWVVCDSAEFDDTDVMPLWSDESAAKAYCTDEWTGYQAVSISVDDYLEHWVSDLNDDGVLLGLNWRVEDETVVETDPIDLAKAFAEYESLRH